MEQKNKKAVFTICCFNYLKYARILFTSVKKHEPNADCFLVLCEEKQSFEQTDIPGVNVLFVSEIGLADYLHSAFKFTILEFNTNIKPTVFVHLHDLGYEKAVYFDPDIKIYDSLEEIWNGIDKSPIAVTPHVLSPYKSLGEPCEIDFLKTGIFNLGFLAVSLNPESIKLIKWWSASCLADGYKDAYNGVFVDQKWCDLFISFAPNLCVLRHMGMNVAYWNLHERTLRRVNGKHVINENKNLIFFHFSGIDPENKTQISKYSNRDDLEKRRDLVDIFNEYRNEYHEFVAIEVVKRRYSYDFRKDGAKITPLIRRMYGQYLKNNPTHGNPFDADHDFYKKYWFLKLKKRLRFEAGNINRKKFNRDGAIGKILGSAFKVGIFVFGVGIMEVFLKGMHHFCNPSKFSEIVMSSRHDQEPK